MKDNTIKFIESVLTKYLDKEEHTAFIFGSRATNSAQKYSDYDIGIEGPELEPKVKFEIEEEFENSDLPYLVDVVEFNNVSNDFKLEAKKKLIPINLKNNNYGDKKKTRNINKSI